MYDINVYNVLSRFFLIIFYFVQKRRLNILTVLTISKDNNISGFIIIVKSYKVTYVHLIIPIPTLIV